MADATHHADGLFGAVEAGGTKFVCAVGDGRERILARATFPTTTPAETFARVRAFFEEAVAKHGRLTAIGVAAFGPIDVDPASSSYGTVRATPKQGWAGVSYVEALAPFSVPVVVDTDVVGAAIGEWVAGVGNGLRTLAYVTVGTGIGAGVIQGGRSVSGFGHLELGHIRPPRDNARDPYPGCCPFHGDCLEGLASGPAIRARWGADLSSRATPHPAIDLESEYLAHLALTLVLAHMPERIVFGGGVMKAPGLIEAVRRKTKALIAGYIAHGLLSGDLGDYLVVPALGDDSAVVGALALARRALETAAPRPM